MNRSVAHVTLLVKEYDEAIAFYTQKLGFELVVDKVLDEFKRWVIVAPSNTKGCSLLLARAVSYQQLAAIGNQAGGRVFLFLHTDSFKRDHQNMIDNGVVFTELPRRETYGTVAVFKDLYGNLWDLIEQKD